MYRLFKDGKFGDAHKAVRLILHSIPLLVVETRREVDEVKELLTIARCVVCFFLMIMTTRCFVSAAGSICQKHAHNRNYQGL